jgi:hypothetical protein
MHSKASDGALTPRELVIYAKNKGLSIIALTDHDTTQGVKEAVETGREVGVTVIAGIEIDAHYKWEEYRVDDIEILGLGIDINAIAPFVAQRFEERKESIDRYIKSFAKISNKSEPDHNDAFAFRKPLDFDVESIIRWKSKRSGYYNDKPFLGRPDFIGYLLDRKYLKAPHEDRRKYIDDFKKKYSRIFNEERKPSFYEAIDKIHNAGGRAVIAHPGLSRGYVDRSDGKKPMIKEWLLPPRTWYTSVGLTPFKFLADLKTRKGLDGVELYNYRERDPEHASDQDLINKYFRNAALRLGLAVTYGSDFHTTRIGSKGESLGKFGSDISYLDWINGERSAHEARVLSGHFGTKLQLALDYCHSAHQQFPKDDKKTYRLFDKKGLSTPYFVHPIWAATTLLSEPNLPCDYSAPRKLDRWFRW